MASCSRSLSLYLETIVACAVDCYIVSVTSCFKLMADLKEKGVVVFYQTGIAADEIYEKRFVASSG
jgi:hypothetical protein